MKRVIKNVFVFCILVFCTLFSISCTPNERAKHYGGTVTIKVEPGYKVTSATFKDTEIWYFIEPMDSTYIPKEKKLIEKSSFGVLEGTIIFKESK